VDEMSAYLQPNGAPVVEAQALNGVGVTATLRAAVARILDHLKSNVDTTLYDAPELARPDMSARSGVTSSSAGTPKLSMKTGAVAPPVPQRAEPEPEPIPVSPFEPSFSPVVEDDPFGSVAVAEPEVHAIASNDPFGTTAAEIHDASVERMQAEELLAGARQLVTSLEIALDQAREHERMLAEKLERS